MADLTLYKKSSRQTIWDLAVYNADKPNSTSSKLIEKLLGRVKCERGISGIL